MQEKITVDISKDIDLQVIIKNNEPYDLWLKKVKIDVWKGTFHIYGNEFSDKEIEEELRNQGINTNLVLKAGEEIRFFYTIEEPKEQLTEEQIQHAIGDWRIHVEITFEGNKFWIHDFEIKVIDSS